MVRKVTTTVKETVNCNPEETVVCKLQEEAETQKMFNKQPNTGLELRIVDIPADVIERKVMQEKTSVTFRNKEIRKAPSWKYLDKWKKILDEEWSHYKNGDSNNNIDTKGMKYNINQEDCRGVNLIVPKRIQQFGGQQTKKFNSTECILDEIIDTKLEQSRKRFMSEGNLLNDFDFLANENENRNSLQGPNYLLSLRDLQSFDKLDILNDLSISSEESDDGCDVNKPRIVGVIYKDKL